MNFKKTFSMIRARHIILACAIIMPISSMHAVSHLRAKVYTMLATTLATVLPLPIVYNDPVMGLCLSALSGTAACSITSLMCTTPTSQIESADYHLASIHHFIATQTFFTNPENVEEKKKLYEEIEDYFATHDSPFIAAKNEFTNNIKYARIAIECAREAQRDLDPEEKDLSERCAKIIEKACLVEHKALGMIKAINKHPDYAQQMTSYQVKKNAEEQAATLSRIQTASAIAATASTMSAINSFHRK